MDEFDRWYAEAIAQGFCLDIPRRCLSTMGTEPLVKVVDKSRPDGYRVRESTKSGCVVEDRNHCLGYTTLLRCGVYVITKTT